MITINDLPSWNECDSARRACVASALMDFIYQNEPADFKKCEKFRTELVNLINEINPDIENLNQFKLHS